MIKGTKKAQVGMLEHFDPLIKEIKLYPDISNVENILRKIIYLFMLETVGRNVWWVWNEE